jgi:DNA primase
MIPQETIERVAAANDIVDVIGAHVSLKKMGTRFRALCPFHREKTPSFYVDPQRQTYKCFGCGVGGTVFKFLMAYENLDFPSAVRRLAERANLPLAEEEFRGGDSDPAFQLKRRLLSLHAEASDWFHRQLMKSPEAQPARDYLRGRGIDREVAASWKLGYAPDSWDAFSEWADGAGYNMDEVVAGGLVVVKDEAKRGSYDRFRDRLMIPISNEQGEVIAFSGRVLAADAKAAKYVNSPETPLFTKGAVLFGLHRARRAIIEAGCAIVCEGQLDLIAAFEAGIENVTAPQGTAFTPRQASILRRCAEEVILCFDSDAAGQQAAERSFAALLEANLTVRVATMPPGEDPDSLIRKRGAAAFRERIDAAKDFFDFQMERLESTFDLRTARGQAGFARRMADSIRLVGDPLLREAVVGKISARLGLPAERLRELLVAKGRSYATEENEAPAGELSVMDRPGVAVSQLVTLALQHEESRAWLLDQPDWRERLRRVRGGELLAKVLAARVTAGDSASTNAFLSSLPPDEEQLLAELGFQDPPAHVAEVREDCWISLEEEELLARRDACQARMRAPNVALDEAGNLHQQVLDLQNRLNDIARLRSSRRGLV